MALINCSECGVEVSNQAISCPTCGAPVNQYMALERRRKVPTIGIVSVGLGICSLFLPYIAEIFIAPAAVICGVIAFAKNQKSFALIGVILGLLGVASVIYTSKQIANITNRVSGQFGRTSTNITDASHTVVNLDQYNQIQIGMPYPDVISIIEDGGDELSRSDMAEISTVMYSWKNPDGSNMNAMFQNGKLINKSQFGLR